MTPRSFGRTGLRVSPVGFGAMHFDGIEDEAEVGRLLNGVLDLGVTLIDTARGYGRSESRIGRHLASRRSEFVLSTKFGYGVEGVEDWTAACIVQGVDRALRTLRTDVIDIGHLHSCPRVVLERGEVTAALNDCVRAGKLRVAAYAGDDDALQYAMSDERFAAVQCSLSLVDRANLVPLRSRADRGVLVKRALGGRPWAQTARPADACEGAYWDRWQALRLPAFSTDWPELALRFAAHQDGVASVLLGTRSLQHLAVAIQAVAAGPLDAATLQALQSTWDRAGSSQWPALI